MRLGRVATDHEDRFGVVDVVVAVGHGAVAPCVRNTRNRGGVTNTRLMVDVVCAPVSCKLAEQIGLFVVMLGVTKPIDVNPGRFLRGCSSCHRRSRRSPVSQLMRFHSPPSFFIGYFRRRSPWACSRTAAPLAQCAPRLNGLSQPGSCPVQTPLLTSATTVQPTEQCVQTDLIVSTAPWPPVGRSLGDGATRCAKLQQGHQWPNQSRAKTSGDQQISLRYQIVCQSAGGVAQPHWSFSLAFSFLPCWLRHCPASLVSIVALNSRASRNQSFKGILGSVLEAGAIKVCACMRSVLHRFRRQI